MYHHRPLHAHNTPPIRRANVNTIHPQPPSIGSIGSSFFFMGGLLEVVAVGLQGVKNDFEPADVCRKVLQEFDAFFGR